MEDVPEVTNRNVDDDDCGGDPDDYCDDFSHNVDDDDCGQ